MNTDVRQFFEAQREAHKQLVLERIPNVADLPVRDAILTVIREFPEVTAGQVIDLLRPWLPKYKVAPELSSLTFFGGINNTFDGPLFVQKEPWVCIE